ncbi:MAG: hypothetical protein Q9192_002477 [Flavoplaca navasiana]
MEGIELFFSYGERGFTSTVLTHSELRSFLAPYLSSFHLINFDVQIFKNGVSGIITTHKRSDALAFLDWYNKPHFPSRKLLDGHQLNIYKSRNQADEILVRILKREEKEHVRSLRTKYKALLTDGGMTIEALALAVSSPQPELNVRQCKVSSFAYGKWEYAGQRVYYRPYRNKLLDATITFGNHSFVLEWEVDTVVDDRDSTIGSSISSLNENFQLSFPYSAIESAILDDRKSYSLIYTMNQAPKIWVNGVRNYETNEYVCCCQDYRFELRSASDVQHLLGLEHDGVVPQCSLQSVEAYEIGPSLEQQFEGLEEALERYDLDFPVKFQLTKLARNGFLSPRTVSGIIDHVFILQQQQEVGAVRTAAALRRLCQQVPYAGPFIQASELDHFTVSKLLDTFVQSLAEEQSYLNHSSNGMLTYKVIVTPSTVQLAGPELESSNRVLRNYANFSDHFLRATFADEDGEPLYFDSYHNNSDVFEERFNRLLQDGIKICGRVYEFLGFSHSSLRAQTCWSLAPFMHNGTRINADMLIFKLGDFSHIRTAARSAARIGQTFTDTSKAIPIDPDIVEEIEDVERNGHVFSDGVGTCSLEVMQMLQATRKPFSIPATVFQIRYAGAKGMISLDNRLSGSVLRLRPSMIKFRGTGESNIEICGVGSRKLPLVLNRSLIKILEDLKVPHQALKNLQDRAINELRSGVSSILNAAALLEELSIGKSTDTPWLLRKMQALGLELSEDVFFRNLLDAAVLTKLQDLKYKTRLPVEQGATLYGVMDEFGTLEEGEVYCCWLDEKGHKKHVSGTVLITRSPALHPGDVQMAKAVNIPGHSPLNDLHNSVVFSAKGERDLPSQLSGGDLDGDIFQVIWDKTLIPTACEKPSDYSKHSLEELDRQVCRKDMSDHFVDFMKNDLLGRVSTLHMILADRYDQGTLHEDCKLLARLHSTAVDFSKTGISISSRQFPAKTSSNLRPDFMAPGRKIMIEEHGIIFEDEHTDFPDFLDPRIAGEPFRKRYYESNKILGILYRSIDERAFFEELHRTSAILKDDNRVSTGVLQDVWEYVLTEVDDVAWKHWIEYAAAMKDTYEAAVRDIILQYSTNPPEYLEEIEVFIGSIICRTGQRSKRQKEFTTGMQEKYDREARAYMAAMRACDETQDVDTDKWKGLRLSMACLDVHIKQANSNTGRLHACRTDSFGWIAAAAVLRELEVFQEDRDVGPLKKGWGMVKKALRSNQKRTNTMDFLQMLEGGDRERLLKRLQSGDIDAAQFDDEVCNFALTGITKRMQLHVPGLSSPEPDDFAGHLSNMFKFINTVSSEEADSKKILRRAENAQTLADDVYTNWGKLRVVTQTYGRVLAKRWTKRTVSKREKILLEAWPGMNPKHRPDFEVVRQGLKGRNHRDAIMLPYINLEDLSFEKNLLELMVSRTKMHPEYFAFSDRLPFKTAVTVTAVEPAAQYDQVMLLTEQKSRDTYGNLRSIVTADVEDVVWTGYAFQLGEGLIVLETQQQLYRFLWRCAELLLHDIVSMHTVIVTDKMDGEEQCGLAQAIKSEPAEWQSVSEMNISASYRLPQPFSLDSFLRLAGAEREAAEDTFWALHEDPGFFQEQVVLLVQQNLLSSAEAFGKENNVEPTARKQAGIHVVLDVCHDIIIWEAIDADLKKLKILRESFSTNFHLSERLPLEYEKVMENFTLEIRGAQNDAPGSHWPRFCDYFEKIPDPHGRHVDFGIRTSSKLPPILDLISSFYDPRKVNMMGALNILDKLARMMETDPVQRSLISAELIKEISELAALDPELVFRQNYNRLNVIDQLEEYLTGTSLGSYTKPASAFTYPVGKKPTPEHTEQMRQAESKLDDFWDNVDKHKLQPKTGKTLVQWLGSRVTVRALHRTKPWAPIVQSPVGSAPIQDAFQPFPDSTTDDNDKLPMKPRKKQKTKGEPSSTPEPAAPPASAQDTTLTVPTIVLPKKLYKTITAFFPTSEQERISRNVVWKDFLHAMYGLSFQIQKRHGSEWYFEPSWKRNAPITIHEPHPSHEMTFDKIRFEARRMARKYGWSNETFVLAD